MTEPERPLHVRVAEALGWEVRWHESTEYERMATGFDSGWRRRIKVGERYIVAVAGEVHARAVRYCVDGEPAVWVPNFLHYDTDWAATGPLIERFKLDLWHVPEDILGPLRWRATCERADGSEESDTPLRAICNLILALHEAGRLPE